MIADPFRPGATLEAARKVYRVSNSDRLGVEFVSDEGTKVLLPRPIIEQWANYIEQHNVPDSIGAQELRDKIKATGGDYSPYLQNFETHYKPAAYALVRARRARAPRRCYEIVAVGADWTGNENILGYANGLDPVGFVTKPSLDLLLNATAHPEIPHFLILDEMNLSHVERYFADILSAIESEEVIHLHADSERRSNSKVIPPEVNLPKNLFIIGTVNVDETTYMFSPKVLDRANVLEFRLESKDLSAFLEDSVKPDLSKIDGKGFEDFGRAFIEAAKAPAVMPEDARAAFGAEMFLFFRILQLHGAEFGYRTVHETTRFLQFYKMLGNYPNDGTWFAGAFDCVIVQKILPKLHGSRAKLGPLLRSVWHLCANPRTALGGDPFASAVDAARATDRKAEPATEIPGDAPYPISAEKVGRMWRLLRENGFSSFAEA